jgi:hypothetical protein
MVQVWGVLIALKYLYYLLVFYLNKSSFQTCLLELLVCFIFLGLNAKKVKEGVHLMYFEVS